MANIINRDDLISPWWNEDIGYTGNGYAGTGTGTGAGISIIALIAALTAKGYTDKQIERYLQEHTLPNLKDIKKKLSQNQPKETSIPEIQSKAISMDTLNLSPTEILRLSLPKVRDIPNEELKTLGRAYGISNPLQGQDVPNIDIPKAAQDIPNIHIPEIGKSAINIDNLGKAGSIAIPRPGTGGITIPETGQDVFPGIEIPEEELSTLGRPYGISNPNQLAIPETGQDVFPGVDKPIPEAGDVAIPGADGIPIPGTGGVAIPGEDGIPIPVPGDIAVPKPGDVAIPGAKSEAFAKPGEEILTKEINKEPWETKNFYPPMINVEKNEEQGEQIMTGLSDTTKENIEYPIDYSGLEAWLMQQQQKMWDREDQIRKETQEREDTAYQRAVEDARKAGINVNLMNLQPAESGGGISTATGIYSGMLENAMSGHSNRYINSMNVGSNEYIAQLNNATKIMEAQINNNFKGSEGDKQRLLDLISEIINGAAMIYAFKKGGR